MGHQLLAGKTALVAGTGPGIGTGIALALAAAGARVACADANPMHARMCARDVTDLGAQGTRLLVPDWMVQGESLATTRGRRPWGTGPY